jgi:hypothetical protein
MSNNRNKSTTTLCLNDPSCHVPVAQKITTVISKKAVVIDYVFLMNKHDADINNAIM